MPDLVELQRAFSDALTAPVERMEVHVLSGPEERTRRRMRFYRGNVQANAAKSLGNAFPVCRALTGDEFFEGLAHVYAARAPSRSGDLNLYGEAFPAFLSDFRPAKEIAYLADVARLEWAVHRAHFAADVARFDVGALAAVPPSRFEELRARLHPACALIESRYPLARLWEIHQPNYQDAFQADFDEAAHYALVYRPRFKVEVTALDAGEFAFLSACAAGANLGQAVERARTVDASFTLDAPLAGWIENLVIVDFLPARSA